LALFLDLLGFIIERYLAGIVRVDEKAVLMQLAAWWEVHAVSALGDEEFFV